MPSGAVPKRDGTPIYIGITKSVMCVTGDPEENEAEKGR